MNHELSHGFVLNIKPYLETDALVSVLTKERGLLRFVYKGYFKSKSKILKWGMPFSYYEFRYNFYEQKLLKPIEITVIKNYLTLQQDVLKASVGQIANSIYTHFNELYETEFDLYTEYIELLDENVYNINLLICLFLSTCLSKMGLSPYVDGSINTKTTKVNDFSIKDGGFIYSNNSTQFTVDDLKTLRLLFKAPFSQVSYCKDVYISQKIMNTIIEYFEYHTSFKLVAYQLYRQLN